MAAGETWSEDRYIQELQAAGVAFTPNDLHTDLSRWTETTDGFLGRLHPGISQADRDQFLEAWRLLQARSASLEATVQAVETIRRGPAAGESQDGTFSIVDIVGNETLSLVARALTGISRPADVVQPTPSPLTPPSTPGGSAREPPTV